MVASGALSVTVLPAAGREEEIRQLFIDTFEMGSLLRFRPACFDEFVQLNLGWFLQNPHASVVAVDDAGTIAGYALVCGNPRSLDRWVAREMRRFCLVLFVRIVTLRFDRRSAGFYLRRTLDMIEICTARLRANTVSIPQVHMNIDRSFRSGRVGLALLSSVDTICLGLGQTSWTGEINAVAGSRERALARLIGKIVDRRRNRTSP